MSTRPGTTTRHALILWLLCAIALGTAAAPSGAAAQTGGWQALGPGDFYPTAMAVSPTSPRAIYMADVVGDGYRSLDGGGSWQRMKISTGDINALRVDPVNPSVVYAAGGGIYISSDRGSTWATRPIASNNPFLIDLEIDPTNPDIFYAAGYYGIYKSTNRGQTWSPAAAGLPPATPITDIDLDPQNSGRLFAVSDVGALYRSTNGAASWALVGQVTATNADRVAIAISPAAPDEIFLGGRTTGGLRRSSDGGATWSPVEYGLSGVDPAAAVLKLEFMPGSPPALLVATAYNQVLLGADSGTSWSNQSDGLAIANSWIMNLLVDPLDPTLIYVSGNGIRRKQLALAPVFSEQPLNHRVRPRTSVTLDAMAGGGGGPYSYQWYYGESGDTSQPVAGATGRVFVTPPVQTGSAYWVRLSNPNGSADSRTARITLKGAYDARLDGFGFRNDYDYLPGDAIPGASWDIFKRTFPASSMELPNGQPRMGARAYYLSSTYQGAGDGGSCFGMAAVSALRYLDAPEGTELAVLNPYYRRFTQVGDLPPIVGGDVRVGRSTVKDYIFLYHGRQQSLQIKQWLGRRGGDTPGQTFEAVRQITAQGNVALLLFSTPGAGHAVLAYGTSRSGDSATIAIYDPNWPGDTSRRLALDLTPGRERWSYELQPGRTWAGSRDLLYLPASMLFPASLNLAQTGAAALATDDAGLTVAVEGDADLLITDGQGRRLGQETLDPSEEIVGAVRLINYSFNPSRPDAISPEAYYLPAGQTYTITVSRDLQAQPALAATTPYTLAAFGDGSALTIGGASLAGAQADELTLHGTPRAATFTPAGDGDYCQALTDEVSADNSREYQTCVTGGAGVGARFVIAASDRTFSVSNSGARGLDVRITTTQIGAAPGTSSRAAELPPGGTLPAPGFANRLYLPLLRR